VCIEVDKVVALASDLIVSLKDLRVFAKDPDTFDQEKALRGIEESWFGLQDAMKGIVCIDRDALIHSVLPTKSEVREE